MTSSHFYSNLSFMSNFEQDSVVSCREPQLEVVKANDYPWIDAESAGIPTFLVKLQDGTEFRFGSLVGLNGTIEKIADEVSRKDSASTQDILFTGLREVLHGKTASGISEVENYRTGRIPLFFASRNLMSEAGLIFTTPPQESGSDPQTVLRVGISTPKQRHKLLGVIGIQ